MSARDKVIRESSDALVLAFAGSQVEQQYPRAFLLRSLEIACGFKNMYAQTFSPPPDSILEKELRQLDDHVFQNVTSTEINAYYTGSKLHPDVTKMLELVKSYQSKGKTADEYEKTIADMQKEHQEQINKLNAAHGLELTAFKTGLAHPDTQLGQLKEKILEQQTKLTELLDIKVPLYDAVKYTHTMGVLELQLLTTKNEVQKMLTRISDDIKSGTLNNATQETIQILSNYMIASGSTATADSSAAVLQMKQSYDASIAQLEQEKKNLKDEVTQLKETTKQLETDKLKHTEKLTQWGEFYTDGHKPLTDFIPRLLTAINPSTYDVNALIKLQNDVRLWKSKNVPTKYAKLTEVTDVEQSFSETAGHIVKLIEAIRWACEVCNKFSQKGVTSSNQISRVFLDTYKQSYPSTLQTLFAVHTACCMQPAEYKRMLMNHWSLCQFTSLNRYTILKSPGLERDPQFTYVVLDIGDKQVRPCILDIASPLLRVETISLLESLISRAKSTAMNALLLDHVTKGRNPTNATESVILRGIGDHFPVDDLIVHTIKYEEDIQLILYLLQLRYILQEDVRDYVNLICSDTTKQTIIDKNVITRDSVTQMVLKLSVATQIQKGSAPTSTTPIDHTCQQILINAGFTPAQAVRACAS